MLEKLFVQHASAMHRYLLRKNCSPSLASDLVQETFLRLAQRKNETSASFTPAYLYRIAHNLMVDHYRCSSTRYYVDSPSSFFTTLVDETCRLEEQVLGVLELERLENELSNLPSRTRAIFVLCRIEGMTHAEVARHLRISKSSVQKHMALAQTRVDKSER